MPKTPDEIKRGLECYFNLAECNKHLHCGECPNNVYTLGEMCDDVPIKDALARIKQLETQVPRWISVEERLPDAKLAVLGYGIRSRRYGEQDPFPSAHIVYTRGEDEGWFTYWNSEHVEVAHWMPLPEPPIGGNSDDFVHGNHG